jgi:hypothetical protein
MRTPIMTGLTTLVAAAAIATPALATSGVPTPVSPAQPAAPTVNPAQPTVPTVNPAQPTTPTVNPAQPTTPNAPVSPAHPAKPHGNVSPSHPAGPNFPQVHLAKCTVARSHRGFVYANCTLGAVKMPDKTVSVDYGVNLHTMNPGGGHWFDRSGKYAIPATKKAQYRQYTIRFAFKNKDIAKVRKDLKVTISHATGGAVITASSARASS